MEETREHFLSVFLMIIMNLMLSITKKNNNNSHGGNNNKNQKNFNTTHGIKKIII